MILDELTIVEYRDEYADDLSEMITRNLLEVNINDYPEEDMKNLALEFAPDYIKEYGRERQTFVALINGKPVGTLGVMKHWDGEEGSYVFLSIFVDPDFHGKGIGRRLIERGEGLARELSGTKVTIPASVTAQNFYIKMGYQYVDNNREPDSHGCIYMYKEIR